MVIQLPIADFQLPIVVIADCRLPIADFQLPIRISPLAIETNRKSAIGNRKCCGGEGGIRTHGTVPRTQHFQCCQFSHSCTSPKLPIVDFQLPI
jgi:hypothetical protein